MKFDPSGGLFEWGFHSGPGVGIGDPIASRRANSCQVVPNRCRMGFPHGMGHPRGSRPKFVRGNGVNHCRNLVRAGLPGYGGFLYMAPSVQCCPHRPRDPRNEVRIRLPGVKTLINENCSKISKLTGSPALTSSLLFDTQKNRRKTRGIEGCRVECRVVSGYSPGRGPTVAGSDSLPGMGRERLPRGGLLDRG